MLFAAAHYLDAVSLEYRNEFIAEGTTRYAGHNHSLSQIGATMNKNPFRSLPFSLHRFECTCTTFDHNIRLEVDEELGTISICVPLNHWRRWYHRVWLAMRFILGITERYGHYDTVELNPDDYGKIRSLLDESERKLKENQAMEHLQY